MTSNPELAGHGLGAAPRSEERPDTLEVSMGGAAQAENCQLSILKIRLMVPSILKDPMT